MLGIDMLGIDMLGIDMLGIDMLGIDMLGIDVAKDTLAWLKTHSPAHCSIPSPAKSSGAKAFPTLPAPSPL